MLLFWHFYSSVILVKWNVSHIPHKYNCFYIDNNQKCFLSSKSGWFLKIMKTVVMMLKIQLWNDIQQLFYILIIFQYFWLYKRSFLTPILWFMFVMLTWEAPSPVCPWRPNRLLWCTWWFHWCVDVVQWWTSSSSWSRRSGRPAPRTSAARRRAAWPSHDEGCAPA